MTQSVWNWVASSGATLAFSLIALFVLFRAGAHRKSGRISQAAIVSCILLSGIGYSLLVAIFGHFYLRIPVSSTIRDYFGDDRIAWLLVALAADVFARFWALFDPD